MSDYKVYVVSRQGNPLMPTVRFWKVRRLLQSGRARVICRKPFTIQLLYDTTEYVQPLILGIDPGCNDIGITVRRAEGTLVEACHLETRREEVSENMTERRMFRRNRRQHQREKRQRRAKKCKTCFEKKEYAIAGTEKALVCRWIKPKPVRFHNRRRKERWQTPTARQSLRTHINLIEGVAKRLPVSGACLEYGKFDIQKLEHPEISGEEYQNGQKKGYDNSKAYVLCRDKHTCTVCAKSPVPLQVHHVIWRSAGGSDLPENLVTLCEKCHNRVHQETALDKQLKAMFAGLPKRYVHATLLNGIMPSLYEWLVGRFGTVRVTYGYETKEKRQVRKWPKRHEIDAYLISVENADRAADIEWNTVPVYEYRQFRRHHRQLIHATRERNYKKDKKIVAKNRKKRTGQKYDSLTDVVEREGRRILPHLRVLPGKKVRRSGFNQFKKGDVVRYKGQTYVVKGYGEMGRRLGFVGQKDYVPANDCRLVVRNKGMVCL